MKHTPGPWEYNTQQKYSQGHGKFSETAVYAAGNAFPWRMAEIQGPDEGTEIATAKLIAAAPDMLEALLRAKVMLSIVKDAGEFECGNTLEQVRAAIAKATGTP